MFTKTKDPQLKKTPKSGKKRLDQHLVDIGLAENRSRAQALILAGGVFVDDKKIDKAGTPIKGNPLVEVRHKELEYVSRGGNKLAHALTSFNLDVKDEVCIDAGISTGGFTHCLLKNGAASITGVDVGYGQTSLIVRDNPRVTLIERTNFRHLKKEDFPHKFTFFVMDVSFISTSLLFPALVTLLEPGARGVVLLKPQFEAGKGKVSRGGILKDPLIHCEVIDKFLEFCYHQSLECLEIIHSPIRGRNGNIEYLANLRYVEELTTKPAKLPKLSKIDSDSIEEHVKNSVSLDAATIVSSIVNRAFAHYYEPQESQKPQE
jgi:23S rRNA (cytidine1920-2'-O)/16S rRNA (cytidine1409-2'-O)-methyltransferase